MWAPTPRQLSSKKNSQSHLNIHDGRAGYGALPDNPGDVYADSAYRGQVFAIAGGQAWSPEGCTDRGLGGVQATIRCARSVTGIIACSASVAGLRRSLEPGNAAMVCGACGGKGGPGEGNPPGPSHCTRLQPETNDDDLLFAHQVEGNATGKISARPLQPRPL